jgi:hypothetical protein
MVVHACKDTVIMDCLTVMTVALTSLMPTVLQQLSGLLEEA